MDILWTQQFQCRKCLSTCKTQWHSIIKEEKKSPRTISSTARAIREHFQAKAIPPATVAHASLLFSAAEPPFTRKNTMFRANPNIQIASTMCENEAFVRGFLQIPKVEDVKTKLSCDASFNFQELKMWNRRFREMLPWSFKSWRCEIEAFVGCFLEFPTGHSDLWAMFTGLCSLRHMPSGHNDLCTILVAGANWTQWSLSYVPSGTCQLDTMISELCSLRHMLAAHANWTQWSLPCPSCRCQLDTMISELCSPRHMPTGRNDLWAVKTIRNLGLLYETSFD